MAEVTSQMQTSNVTLRTALSIIQTAWQELQRSPYVQQRMGGATEQLPDLSLGEAERRSAVGRSLLKLLESLEWHALPHDVALTLRLVRFWAATWSQDAARYWTVIDPRGMGSYGLFLPTAYCGGMVLNLIHQQFSAFSFREPPDGDRYMALVGDYARLVDQFAERTAGQAERGIRMPKVQVQQARGLLRSFKVGSREAILGTAQRNESVLTRNFAHRLESHICQSIEPAFDRALAGLSEEYLRKAPDEVGMGQYPGGTQLYAELLKFHTTQDLTPEHVHRCGLERIGEIDSSMSAIRGALGFRGDDFAFRSQLDQDSRWRATTPVEITAFFERYIARLRPFLSSLFSVIPAAPYGVAPLPEALQASMTFGFYDAPSKGRNRGVYVFNPANLSKHALFNVAALVYHELMPGHHLQFAIQQENADLNPVHTYSFVNAYMEGWAEYAATLVGELGMYESPEERYGRLVMEAFLTTRLVVDTGMNALGWSLEKARGYMRAHSCMPEAEILTETVRYSCDIPGQALAYKLGDAEILELRERVRCLLGPHFDLKEFHGWVLRCGAVPIPDLIWHVEHEATRFRERCVGVN
jgi:uncharacterized protein (DUF885 family)